MTPLHRAAREYATAGIPVFPCRENAKEPATASGFKDATCDLAQIDAWWAENPSYNIALCPQDAGWCVVDLDPPVGEASWAKLLADHSWPEPDTYIVGTPRGGRHIYFTGELPSSASRLGEKIDTRGVGSYVLVPPSLVAGKPYKVLHERDLAELPRWITDALATTSVAAKASVAELDAPGAVARATALLAAMVSRGDVAIEGQGGDDRTYRIACELLNLGLTPETAGNLLEEIWNPACVPPWSADELAAKLENASQYAQNEAGAWGVASAQDAFGPALDKLGLASSPKRSRFHPEDETEQDEGKDPIWLIKELIQEASTNLWLGPTQSYKSFLALDVALAIAAGKETFGSMPSSRGPVFYAAAEGKMNIKRARRRAWRIGREIEGKIDGFFVMSAPMIALADEVQEFGDQITARCKGQKPILIVLDTTSKVMAGLNENDARDAGQFIRFCDSLVEAFGCSVLAIHHTGKDDARGARGSSAFHAGFDSVVEIKATRETKAVEAWIRKHKDAQEREQPFTFEGRLVGPSLVFFPTNAEQHHNLTDKQDDFDPRKVGAALQCLNAYGADNGVSTAVLASQLIPGVENETVEVRQAALGNIGRKLGAMSRAKLRAYCTTFGSGIKWHLPPKSVN